MKQTFGCVTLTTGFTLEELAAVRDNGVPIPSADFPDSCVCQPHWVETFIRRACLGYSVELTPSDSDPIPVQGAAMSDESFLNRSVESVVLEPQNAADHEAIRTLLGRDAESEKEVAIAAS